MTTTDLERQRWRHAASGLRAHFAADYRNNLLLCDPWGRAAHSMVQGWRNIASQGRLDYAPQPRKRFTRWHEAAMDMRASLYSRKRTRLLDSTTWHFWAGHLPRVDRRYIPKARRGRSAP